MITIDVAHNHFSWASDATDGEKWELFSTVEQRLFQHPRPQLIKSSLLVPGDNYKGFTASPRLEIRLILTRAKCQLPVWEVITAKLNTWSPQVIFNWILWITHIISAVMMWPLLSSEYQVVNSSEYPQVHYKLDACLVVVLLSPYPTDRSSLWASADAGDSEEINALKQG